MKLGRWTVLKDLKKVKMKGEKPILVIYAEDRNNIFSRDCSIKPLFQATIFAKKLSPSGPKSYMSLEIGSPSYFFSLKLLIKDNYQTTIFKTVWFLIQEGLGRTVYLSKIHSFVIFSSELSLLGSGEKKQRACMCEILEPQSQEVQKINSGFLGFLKTQIPSFCRFSRPPPLSKRKFSLTLFIIHLQNM